MKLTLFLMLALGVSRTFARCPGADGSACSGNGICNFLDKCECHPNFQGVGCQDRVCPFSMAWSADLSQHDDKPRLVPHYVTGLTQASVAARSAKTHGYVECGGRGNCDRSSGECNCDSGFEGSGCSRMSCPNDCNSHGTCKYISRENPSLISWDTEKTQQCICDPGYTGHDCSERMCPRGLDPMKYLETNLPSYAYVGTHAFGATDMIYFEFKDYLGNVWSTRTILGRELSEVAIEEAFESLPMNAVPQLQVDTFVNVGNKFSFNIGFLEGAGVLPEHAPYLKMIMTACTDPGCQPYSTGASPMVDQVLAETILALSRVQAICSNRGKCDSTNGQCACESGYYGESCSKQTTVR